MCYKEDVRITIKIETHLSRERQILKKPPLKLETHFYGRTSAAWWSEWFLVEIPTPCKVLGPIFQTNNSFCYPGNSFLPPAHSFQF